MQVVPKDRFERLARLGPSRSAERPLFVPVILTPEPEAPRSDELSVRPKPRKRRRQSEGASIELEIDVIVLALPAKYRPAVLSAEPMKTHYASKSET